MKRHGFVGDPPGAEWAGRLLVVLQFGLLTILGWRAWDAELVAPERDAVVGGLLVAAVALAVWALAANRPGNFNIRPTPRDGGVLVTGGPYRWIRHPMYTAVLVAAAAAAFRASAAPDAILWSALLGVLWVKSGVEEQALARRFVDYRAYRQRTKRFLPWVV